MQVFAKRDRKHHLLDVNWGKKNKVYMKLEEKRGDLPHVLHTKIKCLRRKNNMIQERQ